jgi:acyl-coenzyme A synthetase/AMP-(fatty) acid ligase
VTGRRSLWELITAAGAPHGRLHGTRTVISLAELAHASSLGGRLEELRGRSVLLLLKEQLAAALTLIELDGVARRMVLCTPDLAPEHVCAVVKGAAADAWVCDAVTAEGAIPEAAALSMGAPILAQPALRRGAVTRRNSQPTEWILLTSGTTGAPKLVLHTLASLTSALAGQPSRASAEPIVWSTFYDIRRYGGLQIFLRAVHTGSLVLSDPAEPVTDFLARAGAAGVTHISGTPSHWRRALMSGAAAKITPRYVRLSGEIADQGVLDSLRAAYPEAIVAHAFASTEAGVAFEVRDGLAGFPTHLVGAPGPVELRLVEETLQVRSAGNAERYLGENVESLTAADGWVDTGDRMEERAGRYHFVGRRGGVINVGGLKVHPEEVEAVINAHPWVRMSLVRARRNAITGAVVVADVVLAEGVRGEGTPPAADALTRELTESCRRALAAHKVPTMIRIVPALEMSAAGKLVRPLA